MADKAKPRSAAQKAASKKLAARNKAAYRALDKQKNGGKKTGKKKGKTGKKPGGSGSRSKKKGTAIIPLIVGTGVGAGMALGTTALVKTGVNAVGWKLPQIVDKGGPLIGLAVVFGASKVAPALKPLVTPAAIGTALVLLLNWYTRSKAKKGAGARGYARLNGAGSNVAATVTPGAGARAAGSNVARAVA